MVNKEIQKIIHHVCRGNGEFILNYCSSRKTLLFQGKNTELIEQKKAEIISKVADDKVVNLVDEILEPKPKKFTKERNRSANADAPQTNSTETLKEVKRLWNAVEDILKTLKILVKEKEKDQINHNQVSFFQWR